MRLSWRRESKVELLGDRVCRLLMTSFHLTSCPVSRLMLGALKHQRRTGPWELH